MVDMQSSGIDQNAIATYQTYFNFAKLIGTTLNDQSYFTGFIDNFGYSGQLSNRKNYTVLNFINFETIGFPIDGTDDDIDLNLDEVDDTLKMAKWNPEADDNTCMIFISAAPEAMYNNTSIGLSYASFKTVLGVLVGGATSIPGLTDPLTATTLSTADAESVVQKLLEILP
uniref:VWFA domain-containing protein n=1 Tax=Caenorhabditis tropicalis TaxID=1561998 RepID=A0A1I7T5M8_9PELO